MDKTPADSDALVIPDPTTATVLPWNPEVCFLSGDMYMDNSLVAHAPRQILKRQVEYLKNNFGYTMKTGVECEYFLLTKDGKCIADDMDTQVKPCYDAACVMRR